MTVRMTHPISGGEYDAEPQQVPHLENAGWKAAEGQDTSNVEPWPAELRPFGGQEQVRLYNAKTGAYYTAPRSAVPYHRSNGWVEVDEQAEAQAGLDGKTVAELRELAKQRDIKPIPATKPELLAALAGAPAEQAQDQAGEAPAEPESEE